MASGGPLTHVVHFVWLRRCDDADDWVWLFLRRKSFRSFFFRVFIVARAGPGLKAARHKRKESEVKPMCKEDQMNSIDVAFINFKL